MKKIITTLVLLLPFFLYAQVEVSIYDIQSSAGADYPYESSYNNQQVTTGGIVTAVDYMSGQYFISSSQGGAYNGLFVYDNNNDPSIGDSIIISGTVYEYQGYTEIKSLSSYIKVSSGNTIPAPTKIPSTQVGWEPYEGLLVEVENCNVSLAADASGNWKINDGSGESAVSTGIFNINDVGFNLIYDYPLEKVVGVVGINNWERKLHPRSIDDIVSATNAFVLSTEDKFVLTTESFSYPVSIGILNQSNTISSYSLKMQYDQTKFEFLGFTKTGTISESGTITNASSAGNIELNFSGSVSSDNLSTLVYLNFQPLAEGNASLQFNSPTINGSSVNYFSAGDLEYGSDECDIPIGDTLTVVQRPLLNIPSIVVPQQQMDIECFAPESTTGWAVELFYDNSSVSVQVDQASYDSDLDKWTLTTTIPNVSFYELYDMKVSASGGLVDTVRNAVKVISQFKSDYYFIHITDIHLLGHTFYGEAGYETDHTEMDDLEEVINDINLLNPEFVLLTGDLINEGELEDFECLRNHTLTVQLLEKFEVPVYIVPGNHDLGGWDATPPSQGTARRDWWRFFGWRQREVPPTKTEYQSHDYSFDYGNVHFTGLEAYDNYDSYMYDVYGAESFVSSQLTWLNNDLAAAGDKTKVLFYHYDFKDEINLSSLGVDMALWGHTHNDYSNGTHPYDISTASVCDGNRRYRVIRVDNGNLQAENSVQTHSSGDMLTLTYNTTNDGSLDLVSATVQNNHSLSFDHGLVKFIMPKSDFGYNVSNGRLLQVKDNGTNVTCYVEVTIPANAQVTTTVEKKTSNETTSIYDIQYTTVAGDGSYPSELNGQTVTTGGIVTANNYQGGKFFISSSQGGAWNGILVYDDTYSPAIGDSVILTGEVSEYSGYTELVNLTSLQIINSGNTLPAAIDVATNQVNTEPYEGAFVKVTNCKVASGFDQYGNFSVNDGTGNCDIRSGIYNLQDDEFLLLNDYEFIQISGVVGINSGHNTVHPRSLNDIIAANDGFILKTNSVVADDGTELEYPVIISIIQSSKEINTYSLQLQYDADVFQYNGFDKSNTISESGSVTDNSTEGNIELNYSGTANLQKAGTLLKLKFTPLGLGLANLDFTNTTINGYDLLFSEIGTLQSNFESTGMIDDFGISGIKAYPNPFYNKIIIEYELDKASDVNISIYNMAGQLIKVLSNTSKDKGKYKQTWDATDATGKSVDSGTYVYKFTINGEFVTAGQILFVN